MNLTDEQLDALAERLRGDSPRPMTPVERRIWRARAREAARWAEEREGEVVWEAQYVMGSPWVELSRKDAEAQETLYRRPVRAIRVIATTTKEGV